MMHYGHEVVGWVIEVWAMQIELISKVESCFLRWSLEDYVPFHQQNQPIK